MKDRAMGSLDHNRSGAHEQYCARECVLFGAVRWCHSVTSAVTIPGLSIFDSFVKLTRE